MRDGSRGAALLEVLLSLALLAVTGTSVVTLLSASLKTEATLAQREAELREADRVLAALTLLSRTDLDRRLGMHPAGRFVAEVRRPEPNLYRIALRDSNATASELLVTVVYRPDDPGP